MNVYKFFRSDKKCSHIFIMSAIRMTSLRDVAISQNRQKLNSIGRIGHTERTLLVIGSEKVGKTSLVHRLIEKDRADGVYPSTYLLDYKYARESGKNLTKDVCHIWELGNGATFTSLLSVVAKAKPNEFLSVVLVVDLTWTNSIVDTADTLLAAIRNSVESSLRDEKKLRLSEENVEGEDKPLLNPFPVPLVIVGGKYGLFQNAEPSTKRNVCHYLRCLAHILQADLIFYDLNDATLVKKASDLLAHHAFGLPKPKHAIVTDHNNALYVICGYDSFRSIDATATPSRTILDKYKNSLVAYSRPESDERERVLDDPATDLSFQEPAIDELCRQKSRELKLLQEKLHAAHLIAEKGVGPLVTVESHLAHTTVSEWNEK